LNNNNNKVPHKKIIPSNFVMQLKPPKCPLSSNIKKTVGWNK